jgi:hypothetical protein
VETAVVVVVVAAEATVEEEEEEVFQAFNMELERVGVATASKDKIHRIMFEFSEFNKAYNQSVRVKCI